MLFAGRAHIRWLAIAWMTYLVTLVPMIVYAFRHPGALTARYEATTFATEGAVGLAVRRGGNPELPARHRAVELGGGR